MPDVSSTRERRLWIATFAVVASIFASLPLVGALADTVRSEVLGVLFAAGFVVAILAILVNGLRRKARRRELWVGLGVAAAYLMVLVRLGLGPAERTHLFEYGVVSVLIYEALRERRRNGRSVPLPGLVAILAGAGLGWSDEAVQLLLPNRVYDLRDVGVNALAAVLAVVATRTLRWARGG